MMLIDSLAENNFGDTRSGGLAGPMGLFIIVVLAVVTVFLIRNMNTRVRRLPERFPGQGGAGEVQPGTAPLDSPSPGSPSPGVIGAEAASVAAEMIDDSRCADDLQERGTGGRGPGLG